MKLSKNILITAVKVALAAAALGYLLYVLDPERIIASAATANVWYVLAALTLFPLNFILETLLWRRVAHTILPELSFRRSAASLLSGHAAGIVTPARVGDMVGRAWYLPKGLSWQVGSAAFVHRLYDMAVIIGLGLASAFFFLRRNEFPLPDLWTGLWIAAIVLVLLLITGLIRPPLAYRALHGILPARAARHVAFLRKLSISDVSACFLLAALRMCVFVSQFVLLIFAFAEPGAFLLVAMGVSLVFLLKYFVPPLTFLDIGIREGLSVYIFSVLGYPEAAAFNAAFLLFCMNLLLPAAVGVPFLMKKRRNDQTAASREDASHSPQNIAS